MKHARITILFSLIVTVVAAVSAFAQVQTFSDANVDYTFDVPNERWKMTVKPSATSPNVEYVYDDRNDGHLEVRRITAGENAKLSEVIQDEEQKLQFLPGFVAGKEESFSGKLNGSAYNFEFVRAGKPRTGRFYFLKANPTTYYVLRFTGFSDKIKTIRNQTDQIARTFSTK